MPGRKTTPTRASGPLPALTDIEHTVLEGRANGLTYTELADRESYAYISIKKAAARALTKLGARDMAHAILIACHAGILDGRPQRHGDHAAFAAHQRRGEDPWACTQGCPEGERAYRRDLKAARKAAQHDTT
jgi:DNA-binding CsgD family transcriptional regulator